MSPRSTIAAKEAGRAFARYVLDGGRLADVDPYLLDFTRVPLQILPLPAGRNRHPLCLNRREIETDLPRFQAYANAKGWSPALIHRFLIAFQTTLEAGFPPGEGWLRIWLQSNRALHRDGVRALHHQALQSNPPPDSGIIGTCSLLPDTLPEQIWAQVEGLGKTPKRVFGRSPRADVFCCELNGTPVVIKRYHSNPRAWRQRWEQSRARRAWAASQVLEPCGIPAMRGLGWLEHYEGGRLQESCFISRELPPMPTFQVWLRRNLPELSPEDRGLLRHKLRRHLQELHRHGLSHIDLKLSNLLARGLTVSDLTLTWIDLEDIRPEVFTHRTFIRNLYQMNGSLPARVTREEREAFARGFRKTYPYCTHPLLHRYLEQKARSRYRRSLKKLKSH